MPDTTPININTEQRKVEVNVEKDSCVSWMKSHSSNYVMKNSSTAQIKEMGIVVHYAFSILMSLVPIHSLQKFLPCIFVRFWDIET